MKSKIVLSFFRFIIYLFSMKNKKNNTNYRDTELDLISIKNPIIY